MRLLGKDLLGDFKTKYADARSQVNSWEAEVEDARWTTPYDLKERYPNASILGDGQTIFNICGNKYRILAKINYKNSIVLVKKTGTHQEYNKWNL